MHDLQTIIKLNNPVNQRTPALADALKIAQDAKTWYDFTLPQEKDPPRVRVEIVSP